jgi:phosphotransferase system enzyme I (PtsI)
LEEFIGKSVQPGVAIGEIFVFGAPKIELKKNAVSKNPQEDYLKAKEKADKQLEALFLKTKEEIGENEALIIDSQRLMLNDVYFVDGVLEHIKNEGRGAIEAVETVGKEFADMLAALDDEYMKARSTDVLDVSKRICDVLSGREAVSLSNPSIVVAEDLTPSETLQLDRSKILAFVVQKGSPTSHTAILAGVLNIPTLIQTPVTISESLNGKTAAVDGINGKLYVDPDGETLDRLEKLQTEYNKKQKDLLKLRDAPCVTKNGVKIDLFANIAGISDAEAALANGAEGVGLFRSEFLYLQNSDYPTEEQQFQAYAKVAKAMGGKKVVIRTMDIGADKKIDYFNLADEENPALGYRAIRVCLDRPELFRTQLRAIYRAAACGNVSVMFPMIASVWEVKKCKEFCAEVLADLKAEGRETGNVEIGIMIETPASVFIAGDLAKEVDFFSVGTNDLTQYTLAVDRQNNSLEKFIDSHHPAILKALEIVGAAAKKRGIWAGICGELGADTSITQDLIKMGFTEISVSPGSILKVKEQILNTDF